jgi:hypothetical protein
MNTKANAAKALAGLKTTTTIVDQGRLTPSRKGQYTTIQVRRELHRQLKAKAALEGKTIEELTEQILSGAIL